MEGSKTPCEELNLQDIIFKAIDCQIHSNQPFIIINPQDEICKIKCFGCCKQENINIFLTIDQEDFIEQAKKLLTKISSRQPDSNLNIEAIDLDTQLQNIQQGFEKKKVSLSQKIDLVQDEFIQQCKLTKRKLFNNFDSQFQNIKANINSFNNILQQYSGKNQNTFKQLLIELVQSLKFETYNNIISQFINFKSFEQISSTSSPQYQKAVLEKFRLAIVEQSNSITQESDLLNNTMEALNNLQESVIESFKPLHKIQKNIGLLSLAKYSNELPQSQILIGEKLNTFNKLTETKFTKMLVKVKLLYRGSKDGFSAASFHQKCDNIPHTLTLVKTTNDEIFGGYADVKWNEGSGYIVSDKCWLFSLYHNNTYSNKNSNCGINNNSSYGPIFGGGHDLCIYDKCDQNNSNYSSLGHSYENNSKSYLGSQSNFTVKDIEVYILEF